MERRRMASAVLLSRFHNRTLGETVFLTIRVSIDTTDIHSLSLIDFGTAMTQALVESPSGLRTRISTFQAGDTRHSGGSWVLEQGRYPRT